MEPNDAAWRAILASIDRYESGEALLEALLSDQHAETPRAAPTRKQQRQSRPASPASESSSDQSNAIVKKRRKPQARPKAEIDRLRDAYDELEAVLRLLQQRQAKRPRAAKPRVSTHASTSTAESQASTKVWHAVASRQFQYLRDSQATNQRLRAQLQHQMNIIQGIVRLIKRAQAGLPIEPTPRTLLETQPDEYVFRRGRLIAAIERMAGQLDETLQDDPFTRSFDADFREVYLQPPENKLNAGALIATSSSGYLAPHSQNVITERWWERIRKRTSHIQDLHFKHVDRGEDSETVSYSIGLKTPAGCASYSGLAMSRRLCSGPNGHVVFLGVHELCPVDGTLDPMTAVEYRMQTVSLIQPFRSTNSFTQITVKTHATRLEQPRKPVLSLESASIFLQFVSDTLDFLHVQLQRQIDSDFHDDNVLSIEATLPSQSVQ